MDDNSNSKVVGKLNEKEANCSTLSGSVKRSRTPNSGIHVASCLVDGCNSDLRKCRDYHRRHKVCELHSKTPKVIVRGQEQRFCQQCSRFHSLEEFDEGKRSCRKRLDGHNRRRRKPQPEPLHLTSAAFLAQYEGTRFLAFNHPQILPTSPILSYGTHHHHHHVPFKFDTRNDSIGHDATTKRHSSFESTIFHGSYSPSTTELNFTSENASSSSNRARSLLSSSPETPEDDEGLRHMMMMHPNAMITQPHHLHHLDALGIHNNTNLNICHQQSMFDTNIVSDGSSSSVHHKLFSWE